MTGNIDFTVASDPKGGDRVRQVAAIGVRFGKLTVSSLVPGTSQVICQCDCGKECRVFKSTLERGAKRSCCRKATQNRKDYAGIRFGALVAVSFSRLEQNGNSIWNVRCDCGYEGERIIRQLVQGMTKSCGCKKKEALRRAATLPDGEAIRRSAYSVHIKSAQKRGYVSALSKDEYLRIAAENCYYCGEISVRTNVRTGETISLNSVDRKDNEPYYRLDNSVACCFTCQRMKYSLPFAFFIEKVRQISKRHV
jgi:hypothetical protein